MRYPLLRSCQDEMLVRRAMGFLVVCVKSPLLPPIIAFGPPIVFLALAWWFSSVHAERLGDNVRYAGLALQLLGVGTVAWGLHKIRKLFGRPSTLTATMSWFKRLRGALQKPITGTGAVYGGNSYVSAEASVTDTQATDVSLEGRVTALQKRCTDLEGNLRKTRIALEKSIGKIRDDLAKERRDRHIETLDLRQNLEEISVGGLTLEFIGLVWLILGIVFATIPEEIARHVAAVIS